jgi:hypothetical protein
MRSTRHRGNRQQPHQSGREGPAPSQLFTISRPLGQAAITAARKRPTSRPAAARNRARVSRKHQNATITASNARSAGSR